MVPTDLIDKYRWVDDIEAWTVSVISGRGWEDVVRLHGGDPTAPVGDLTFAGVDERRGPQTDHLEFYVQVLVHGDAVVTFEHNGWSGSLPEIARRCSVGGGRFFSVYWNVNAFGLVTQAVDGAIAAQFEALYPLDPEEGQGELRPGWAIGPPVAVGLAWRADMALLEQQTGVAIDPAWLRMPLPTYRTVDPHWLYRDVDGADRI